MTDKPEQIPIRATWIKAGRLSMAHMRLAATTEREDTPAMRWGRLVHMAILEPAKFAALPVWRGARRAGKEWDAFEASVGDGEYITEADLASALAISGSARVALATLPAVAQTELQINWSDPVYGAATARIDAVTANGSMIELKTCAKIDERLFRSQAWALGYNLQLGWYDHGLKANEFNGTCYVLAIESKPPYCCAVYEVPDGILAKGYEESEQIARHYRACEACGVWPGPYDGQMLRLEAPDWAMPDEVEIE